MNETLKNLIAAAKTYQESSCREEAYAASVKLEDAARELDSSVFAELDECVEEPVTVGSLALQLNGVDVDSPQWDELIELAGANGMIVVFSARPYHKDIYIAGAWYDEVQVRETGETDNVEVAVFGKTAFIYDDYVHEAFEKAEMPPFDFFILRKPTSNGYDFRPLDQSGFNDASCRCTLQHATFDISGDMPGFFGDGVVIKLPE